MTATAAQPVPLVDVSKLHPAFILDVRYATAENFFGKKVYPVARCLLRPEPAQKLLRAYSYLSAHHHGLRFVLKDCYRPASIQFILWDAVKGTPKSKYVANPYSRTGSMHSYGAAVDLTLADWSGKELDMGTPYDHLGELAEPRKEQQFLKQGKLTQEQINNRLKLRDAMVYGGGFKSIPNEWWHFDDGTHEEVLSRYEKLDVPLTAVP